MLETYIVNVMCRIHHISEKIERESADYEKKGKEN
jgi:hypothetical protein